MYLHVAYQFKADGIEYGFADCCLQALGEISTPDDVISLKERCQADLRDQGYKNPSVVILNWQYFG